MLGENLVVRNSFLLLSFFIFFLSGCSTSTPYKDLEHGYGKTVTTDEDGFKGALFSANELTRTKTAYHFSRMAAVEHCMSSGKLALILSTENATKKETYTKVSSYKTYDGSTQVTSYPVTDTFPRYVTVFRCTQKASLLQGSPEFEALSKELVSPYTKDFKGALLVNKVKEGPLRDGDVLISVNGQRIVNMGDYLAKVKCEGLPNPVDVQILRQEKIQKIKIPVVDFTSTLGLANVNEVKVACDQEQFSVDEPYFCKDFQSQKVPTLPSE